ncbi:hypothetical protein BLA60_38205 [Actinophytocola xinjiangensis]|uniref:Lipoprotein n=1 Tax=Actinophytocola xinjiangensis TaxID=485602 RepID=A0A7Z0WEC2_9PSEU|nr:hypothetical protein [Actinophytocola xinjiangensis]OLF04931.1 hypothetical protein BLA60_38205 [Actinophytocola xinjiangensis]
MVIRRLVAGLATLVVLAGCAQPTAGAPVPNQAAADLVIVDKALKAFQEHFGGLGDEHARVYNYLNHGDTKITTEHESYKLGQPPVTLLLRRQNEDGDQSAILHQPDAPVDLVRLDERHKNLAPTPWVSVPTLYQGGFQTCFLLTAWVACHLDNALAQTKLEAPDRLPREVVRTDDGYEVTTGALLGLMLDEGFITVPDDQRDEITDPMRESMVPVTFSLNEKMRFTGFDIRGKITDGDAVPLEIQIGYEVLGKATEDDFPEAPGPKDVTVITDKAKADEFWAGFNARQNSN